MATLAETTIPSSPSYLSPVSDQDGSPLQPRCYCTILEWRARYMQAGFQETPCDGTLCEARRVAAAARSQPL